MTAIVDVRGAAIAILKADAGVAALVGTRVYGEELPRADVPSMPRKAVVIAPGGGVPPTYASGTLPLEAQRLDVFCYGETLFQADLLRRTVYGAFHDVERQVFAGVMVHWVRPAGGAMSGRDPDANWPVHWNSWQILADTRTAA